MTLKIDKCNKIELKTDKENVQQVRIIPKGNHIIIEIHKIIKNIFDFYDNPLNAGNHDA